MGSDVKASWQLDGDIQKLITELQTDPNKFPDYIWQHDMLHYKSWLIVRNTLFRSKLIHEHHSTPSGGHSGGEMTYRKIKQSFFWKGLRLKQDVLKFVAECDICQRNKHENVASPGLLQLLLFLRDFGVILVWISLRGAAYIWPQSGYFCCG